HEAHLRIARLVLIAAPVVENCLAIAVEVDEEADIRKAIEEPHDVTGLRLRGSTRTDISLVITRLSAAFHCPWRKAALEIPHDRKVSIEIDADALGPVSARRRAAVLPPPWMPRHTEVAAIGIYLGKENDVLGLDDPADLHRRERFLPQTNALAVAIGAQEPD